jgi:hypothetical protein
MGSGVPKDFFAPIINRHINILKIINGLKILHGAVHSFCQVLSKNFNNYCTQLLG